ncbi:MAG TPA: SRPBCC family protein [Chloroflexota bacterium]
MALQESTLDTKASPEAVWRIWSAPETWPEWNPDVTAISLDGPLAAGARGSMTTKRGGTHQVTIESVEPGRSFWLVSGGLPGHQLAFRCQVLPSGGGSRVSQGVDIRGPLGGLLSGMMGRKIAQSFEPILRALAARAEAAG